jgi:P27 family predicted phage terminase small subunit
MQKVNKKHIDSIRKSMEEIGTYNQVDDKMIEQAALILTMLDQAKKELEKYVQIYPTGATNISPELNNVRGLIGDFNKIANQLGLTPASRKRLGIEKKKEVKSSILELRKKPA